MKTSKKGKRKETNSNLEKKQQKHSQGIQEQFNALNKSPEIIKNHMVKNVEIQFDQFQQTIQGVNIQSCINPQTKGLNIKRLISLLQKQFNIFTKDKLIKFFFQEGAIFVTVPSPTRCLSVFQIEHDDYLHNQTLKLQLFKNQELIDVVMHDSQIQSDQNPDDQDEADNDQKNMEGKCRRLKERKIKHVIEKVLKWRQLYAGMENGEENASKRVPLQEGAKLVKISKKTLDDYLSQLKKGKKYGFNFNDHKNQKIGVLRQFIRKVQKKK